MPRQIALLRGINVGKAKQVPMGRLRELMEEWGYEDVVTLLRSGNVVFTGPGGASAKFAEQLAERLREAFGFEIRVVVRSAAELAKIVKANPLAGVADDPSKQLVLFLSDRYAPGTVADLDPADFEPEAFHLAPREIHLWVPGGINDSPIVKALTEKRLGVTVTGRNWRTLEKLLALAQEG
jgi:uncharacterized protein (DUF1697 family)